MKLNFDQIQNIITGAVRVEEENGAVIPYRFTKEQEELYRVTNPEFHRRSHTTAGIKLRFKTDSKNLFLKVITSPGSSRSYFSVDVLVDGKPAGYIDNFSNVILPKVYVDLDYPLGVFSKNFDLGDGVKTVCIHLPFSVKLRIEEISVDDFAFVEAVKHTKKLLAFGDSITHGYDALRSSSRYIARISEALSADEYNKAIGGEIFFPALAELKDSFAPDYVTVAYGTNDWNCIDADTFKKRCRSFYENVSRNYPEAKIFAISPIWRKDLNEKKPFGTFADIETHIRECVKDLENVIFISGYDLVPQDEMLFADLRLHPNDNGFGHQFENLYNKIKLYL